MLAIPRRARHPVRRDALDQRARAGRLRRSPQRARSSFATVELVDDPVAAVRRAHALGEPVLVTGSLYLLADLETAEPT